MKKQAIIVAAGKGSRMGTETPKQFLLLGGKPVVIHSMEAFLNFDPDISLVVVLPPGYSDEWEKIKSSYNIDIEHKTTEGGASRFISVKNGLELIEDEGLVAVHDGARPLITADTIAALYEKAAKKGSAIPYSLPADSIRLERKDANVIIDRSSIRLIQTPQVFEAKMLKQAYRQKEQSSFTDDASVFEKAGGEIHLAESPSSNIKITREDDLRIAEALLAMRKG